MRRRRLSTLLAAGALLVFASGVAAREVVLLKKYQGTLRTNVAGTSMTQQPYIQIIRSREGLEYTLSRFDRLKNRVTRSRTENIKKQFAGLDYEKRMIIGVFSQPMDNYKMSIEDVSLDEKSRVVHVNVSYEHAIKNPRIPPKKSIYYILAVLPKMDYPVILQATEKVTLKGKTGARSLTVTGRLMPLTGDALQLVPVVIKKGSKNSYYIQGGQVDELIPYLGKVITLQGTVSRERDSPYEFDFTVEKVLKIYR